MFGVIAGGALLGMILLSATAPLMPTYEARLGAEAALDDQRAAAAIMWVTGMLTTLPLLVLAVWRWAATEERIARRAEALADAATHAPRSRRRSRVDDLATADGNGDDVGPIAVEHPVGAAGQRGEQRRGDARPWFRVHTPVCTVDPTAPSARRWSSVPAAAGSSRTASAPMSPPMSSAGAPPRTCRIDSSGPCGWGWWWVWPSITAPTAAARRSR